MAYTIVDLLDKFISIEQAGYKMYTEIAKTDNVENKIKTIAKIFAMEEKKHIEVYKSLKKSMEKEPDIEVDFFIYDKASTLIYQFTKLNKVPDTTSPKRLLEYCLSFEKDNLALLLSIKGILIKSKADEESINYKILSKLISEEQKHVENIKCFIEA